jgi:hypothetical protein
MILESRIDNRTLANVRAMPMHDLRGADVVVVVVRLALAYDVDGRLALASRPIRIVDIPDGHGALLHPSDFEAEKPGTDVGLVGHLEPPRRVATEVVAGLRMGSVHKGIKVRGPSKLDVAQGRVVAGTPEPITEAVPLVYAACFGGHAPRAVGDEPAVDPTNPVGSGFGDPAAWIGKPAPRLAPFASTDGPASQACFAPLPRSWEPRASRAGTYDGTWARTRAPLAPLDRDPAYASWASPGLHAARPLRGDEPLHLGGIHGAGDLELALPLHPVRIAATVLGVTRDLPTHLDSVLVDADQRVVELTWRARFDQPKKLQMIERVRVETERDLDSEIAEARLADHPEPGVQP